MGLIKAGIGALGGVLADQWKEFFYCEALDMDTLMVKGTKRVGGRSSNTKGSDNLISNGSGIAVADGQCMIIVEQGKVVEVCAEPGEYTYDTSTEPSIFAGSFGESLKNTFKAIGKRFTYGGDTGKDQRVYYFNTKEIMGNKFGTPSPIVFEVCNKRMNMYRTVELRCNGVYSYIISDPLKFYTRIAGNVSDSFTRDILDEQLKAEFVDALQPAFGTLSEMEIRPAQIPAKANELKKAMNDALQTDWAENRGISVAKIALNPITLKPEDLKKIQTLEDAMTAGQNPFMMAGLDSTSMAEARVAAANNTAGAMTGGLAEVHGDEQDTLAVLTSHCHGTGIEGIQHLGADAFGGVRVTAQSHMVVGHDAHAAVAHLIVGGDSRFCRSDRGCRCSGSTGCFRRFTGCAAGTQRQNYDQRKEHRDDLLHFFYLTFYFHIPFCEYRFYATTFRSILKPMQ